MSVDPSTGQTTYTPAPGFTGQDTYVYTVQDRDGQPTSATVTIDVYPATTSPAPSPAPEPLAVGHAELVVTKTVTPKIAAVGDVLTYTVTVTNRGPDTAGKVVGTDASTGLNHITGGTVRGTQVCWTVSSLAASTGRSFVIRASAVSSRTQAVTNVATVGAHGIATRSARATVVIFNPVPSFTG